MDFIINVFLASWDLLLDSALYVIFGILIGGLLKVFLSPATVARHLGKGRFAPVIKAAIFGIPIPLCSCGVLPAAASLRKQGANNGATTAFLISTPESGVDSIAITYALLDPIMTIARPVSAFFTAVIAGITENLFDASESNESVPIDQSCPIDRCCDGIDCPPDEHSRHHSFKEKLYAGLKFAITDLWGDLAGWFLIGLLIGGFITILIPQELMTQYMGGGLLAMLIMLGAGVPLYICATASTPIAAALILKGVSPGAVLVFLLVGPATNATSLTVLLGILGKRATIIYLFTLSACSVLFGLLIDQIYMGLGFSAQASAGQAAHIIPFTVQLFGAIVLLVFSVKPIYQKIKHIFRISEHEDHNSDCTCSSASPILPVAKTAKCKSTTSG